MTIMKKSIFSKTLAAVVLASTPLLWSACTDTWNEHYEVVEGGMADQPTLLESIKADSASLKNFYKVIKAIGCTEVLNSPQQLTVWAPKGMTESQADSVIAVYQADVNAGLKWEDNKAVKQFFQNHVAQYIRTISSLTDDTIKMQSNKYMHLVGSSNTTGTLSGNPFNETVLCSNGVLYKTENVQTFFPNVREYLEQTEGMDSVISMIASFDEYELDESSSVAGGVVDGKTIYLDSVINLTNDFLRSYGYIQREDSLYAFLAPTNEVWNREYEKYHKYFAYNPTVNQEVADSLTDINTKLSIVMGRFFNISTENRYNRHPSDSLVNTMYYERQSHNPRQNVYYKPEEGILNGLKKVECSNGYVYVDNQGVIDPHTTFFGRTDLPAYYPFYYEVPKDEKTNESTMNVNGMQYNIYWMNEDGTAGDLYESYRFTQVTAVTPTAQTSLVFKLPQTLSNVYYNIYVVTVPDYQKGLPCWFQVGLSEKKEKGSFSNAKKFDNPHPVTDDPIIASLSNSDMSAANRARCYIASAEKMDTILIQSGVQFQYSSAGLDVDECVAKLEIGSIGPSNSKYRESIYTRTLRLNEIILVPFETKEEADAAADDIDAFNDKILEANKEN